MASPHVPKPFSRKPSAPRRSGGATSDRGIRSTKKSRSKAKAKARIAWSRTEQPDPFERFETAAEAHRRSFDAGDLGAPPKRRLAILTCIDARIDPLAIFGLDIGDAHVIRNTGARASDDALRSLIVSTIRLGVDLIAVVHHTGCGASEISHLAMCDLVLDRTGTDPAGVDFLFFADQAFALRSDVERISTCPYLPAGTSVAGFLYDVSTGQLRRSTPTSVVRPHHPPSIGGLHGRPVDQQVRDL